MTLSQIFNLVSAERSRQERLYKDQNDSIELGFGFQYVQIAKEFKNISKSKKRKGTATWDIVLLEEVYESLAETDPAKITEELIQVMAVCAAVISKVNQPIKDPYDGHPIGV